MARHLLHLSDIHFGPPHLPRVRRGLMELIEERRPDLVAISGDLTQRARPEQFRQARAFVDAIPVPSLVVPGNHDVPLFRVWARALAPFRAYRRWFSPELEPSYQDDELLVVGLNSAYNWTFTEGRLTRRQLRRLERTVKEADPTLYKVVVVHHHMIHPPLFGGQSVFRRSRQAAELFSRLGVDLVLSGHLHQAYLGTSEEFYPAGGRRFLILHSGTSTSSRGRGGEEGRNSCNWIRVEASTVEVQLLLWEEEEGTFVERRRSSYPRGGEAGPAGPRQRPLPPGQSGHLRLAPPRRRGA